MNIFIREMRAHRKSIIIWCTCMLIMVAGGMGKYAGMSISGQSINEILAQMPKSVQSLMGAGLFDLSKASGFYGVLFLYLQLMAAIHASMLGTDIISKEERDKTSEFLFVKPVSRNKIITAKLFAAVLNILILNIVTLVSSILIVRSYSNGEATSENVVVLIGGMFILQLIFMFIGTAIAAVSKNPKTAVSVSTGILLVTFMLSMVIDINSNFESLKYITPFKYYEASNLMLDGGYDLVFIILSVAVIVVLSSITYIFYKKRDLNV